MLSPSFSTWSQATARPFVENIAKPQDRQPGIEASFITGQVIHVNGGQVVNG